MGLQKGATNNPSGRPPGSRNKRGSELKEWIKQLLDSNRETFEADLMKCEPSQRLMIMDKLMSYVLPKMQSVDATVAISEEYNALERLLQSAPDDAIAAIADKVRELNKHKKK